MSQYRYILFSLLVAGFACAQAQTPIVKVNPPGASECDVTAAPGNPIFQLDATGNVIVTGTMSGPGCATVVNNGGGTPTFGFNPPAAGLTINGGATSVGAGSVTTVPFTYQAYNAPSCTVGQPAPTGTCPAITANSGGCTGTGAQLGCSPSAATLSIPTVASMGSNTSCAYGVTANCSGVTSSATLTVTTTQGGGGPAACTGANAVNPIGLTWQKTTDWTWLLNGGSTVRNVDATDYRNIYSPPPQGSPQPWPSGSTGVKPTVSIAGHNFLAMAFTVPVGATANPKYFNVNSSAQGVAMTVSECPGDFGQAGTHITNKYCKSDLFDGGLQTKIGGTGLGTCTLVTGRTYYLNFIDAELPAAGSTTQPTNACTGGGSCNAQVEIQY